MDPSSWNWELLFPPLPRLIVLVCLGNLPPYFQSGIEKLFTVFKIALKVFISARLIVTLDFFPIASYYMALLVCS